MTVSITVLALAALLWSYWPVLTSMAGRWEREEEYTHGWLVPLFALVILGLRLEKLGLSSNQVAERRLGTYGGAILIAMGAGAWAMGGQAWLQWLGMGLSSVGVGLLIANWTIGSVGDDLKPAWTGILLILLAGAGRWAGAALNMEWVDSISLLPCIAGIVLAAGGRRLLSWSWPAIAYLVFMIPLPYRIEIALRQPLRELATVASTYTLQTFGLPAYSEGTAVIVNDVHLDIVEACSGLRMLMIFFALSFAVALLSNRMLWQRALLVISAVPIAIISNVFRITLTGLLYMIAYEELAGHLFHDLAGWFMMPIALVMLGLELWYLDRLVVIEHKTPMAFGLGPALGVGPAKSSRSNSKAGDRAAVPN